MFKGIDVSHNQGAVNWKQVQQSGVQFAMLRACYGWDNDNQIDKQLKNNVSGCEATGLPYGLYHYSYAHTPEEARREAAFFLRVIKGLRPAYPVAFDFEEATQVGGVKNSVNHTGLAPALQIEIITAFLREIEKAGYYGILYMSASHMERLWRFNRAGLSPFDCWPAHIGNVDKPAFSGPYGMWQYSWKGRIDGITGDVDLDYAYKDYPSIIRGKK